MIKIKFLGTQGNINPSAPYHSKHSGILVNDKILLDLGEKEFLEINPEYIFITHLHSDHAFFLNSKEKVDIQSKIYAPEESDKASLNVLHSDIIIDNFHFIPIPTIHSRRVKSQAYILEKDNKRMLYTSDLVWISKKYHKKLHDLDLVITEGSFMRKGGMIRRDNEGNIWGHNGIPDLVNLFEDYTDYIIITHFGNWFYNDIENAKQQIRNLSEEITIECAYDGMTITI
jgi:ribonuclease BN (tRNA processing enzyme)